MPIVKTKLVKIPKDMLRRCEFHDEQSHCGMTAKYYLSIRSIYKKWNMDKPQGMFLCEIHKEPRISAENDYDRGEIKIYVDWIFEEKTKDNFILKNRWSRKEKKGTHKIGEVIRIL